MLIDATQRWCKINSKYDYTLRETSCGGWKRPCAFAVLQTDSTHVLFTKTHTSGQVRAHAAHTVTDSIAATLTFNIFPIGFPSALRRSVNSCSIETSRRRPQGRGRRCVDPPLFDLYCSASTSLGSIERRSAMLLMPSLVRAFTSDDSGVTQNTLS